MRRVPTAEIERLDQMLVLFMRHRQAAMGDASGLGGYYNDRLAAGWGLADYERWLVAELGSERRVYHAGIGIGGLTIGLALSGVRCVGFEYDYKRHQAALALRELCPPRARYDLRHSGFPDGLLARDRTEDATLLFTNVGAGWDDAQFAKALTAIGRFRRTLLDLRLFGRTYESSAERDGLVQRLVEAGYRLRPLAGGAMETHYVEVRPLAPVPLWRRTWLAIAAAAERLPIRIEGRRR